MKMGNLRPVVIVICISFALGLFAAVLFVLVLTGILPLGIDQPITLVRIGRWAAKWQTLIGALVALCAAGLAYQAAMAKVEYDRDRERRELDRKKINLYLKVRFDCLATAEAVDAGLHAVKSRGRSFEPSRIEISISPGLEAAWENLDLLSERAAQALDEARFCILRLGQMLRADGRTIIHVPSDGFVIGDPMYMYDDTSKALRERLGTLTQEVNEALREIRGDAEPSETLRT